MFIVAISVLSHGGSVLVPVSLALGVPVAANTITVMKMSRIYVLSYTYILMKLSTIRMPTYTISSMTQFRIVTDSAHAGVRDVIAMM
jgi:hypothetical protein